MTDRITRGLLFVLVLLLMIGTQMPGAWQVVLENSLHSPWGLSSWAHLVLFAGMAWVASTRMAWHWPRVVLAALALALLTEGLQFFSIDRHPRLADLGIDLAGAGLGLVVRWVIAHYAGPRNVY